MLSKKSVTLSQTEKSKRAQNANYDHYDPVASF